MSFGAIDRPLIVVVGGGGVGKTTLAAALGLVSASEGGDTLVMTFDPSARLKDALGVGEAARDREVAVQSGTRGRLDASLLDARATFDRLVQRYAPDDASCRRILDNHFYQQLAGNLAGILEYMAVERLFEVAALQRYDRVILDTPPTRQALDFLQAPERMIGFLESGALKLALRRWFDDHGRLRATSRLRALGRGIEGLLDRVVGLQLLREMAEFFQIWAPLYEGFKARAREVQALLRARGTLFVLVAGPGEERIADALFFARRLREAGHRLGPIVVNRVHPRIAGGADAAGGMRLLAWLGERDHRGVHALRDLLAPDDLLVDLPLLEREPTSLEALEALGRAFLGRLDAAAARAPRGMPRRGRKT